MPSYLLVSTRLVESAAYYLPNNAVCAFTNNVLDIVLVRYIERYLPGPTCGWLRRHFCWITLSGYLLRNVLQLRGREIEPK